MTFDEIAKKCFEMLMKNESLGDGLTKNNVQEVIDYINNLTYTSNKQPLSDIDKQKIIDKIQELKALSQTIDGKRILHCDLDNFYTLLNSVKAATIKNSGNGGKK